MGIPETRGTVPAISKHIRAEDTLSSAGKSIRVDEPADLGIIVPALEIVESRFCVVEVAATVKKAVYAEGLEGHLIDDISQSNGYPREFIGVGKCRATDIVKTVFVENKTKSMLTSVDQLMKFEAASSGCASVLERQVK